MAGAAGASGSGRLGCTVVSAEGALRELVDALRAVAESSDPLDQPIMAWVAGYKGPAYWRTMPTSFRLSVALVRADEALAEQMVMDLEIGS